MNVISVSNWINIIASATEAELILSGLRALNARHEQERTMTPQLKDQIITAIILIEGVISTVKETPELLQMTYDFQSNNRTL